MKNVLVFCGDGIHFITKNGIEDGNAYVHTVSEILAIPKNKLTNKKFSSLVNEKGTILIPEKFKGKIISERKKFDGWYCNDDCNGLVLFDSILRLVCGFSTEEELKSMYPTAIRVKGILPAEIFKCEE